MLVVILGFLLFVGVCTYLIILIKNLNESIKIFKSLLKTNKDNVNNTLKDLPVITKNLVEASEIAKDELEFIQSAIKNVSDTAEMTAATAQTVKTGILGKIESVIEVVEIISKLFSKGRKKKTETETNKEETVE